MEAIDIYKHPDFFYCNRLKAWMMKKRCLEYQTMASRAGVFRRGFNKTAMNNERALSCGDCEQGKEVKKDGRERRGNLQSDQ